MAIEPARKAASAVHLLALGACFAVQSGGLESSGMSGVRRALQTMETRPEPSQGVDPWRFADITAPGDLHLGIARLYP
jgi:hypothetical protein